MMTNGWNLSKWLKFVNMVDICQNGWNLSIYSESQIYEYITRVLYNVVFSTYLGSNAAEKQV